MIHASFSLLSFRSASSSSSSVNEVLDKPLISTLLPSLLPPTHPPSFSFSSRSRCARRTGVEEEEEEEEEEMWVMTSERVTLRLPPVLERSWRSCLGGWVGGWVVEEEEEVWMGMGTEEGGWVGG